MRAAIEFKARLYAAEPLESRLLLATISWLPGKSGDFHDPRNWNTGTVPGINDDAVIGTIGSNTVILSQPASVRSLVFDNRTGNAQLNASAPLTIAAESRIGAPDGIFANASSTLSTTSSINGAGLLRVNRYADLFLHNATVNAPLHVNSRVVAAGATTINGPFSLGPRTSEALLTISATNVEPAHLTIASTFTNTSMLWFVGPTSAQATLTVTNGQLINEGSISVGGTASAAAPRPRLIDAELVNNGSFAVSAPLTLRRPSAAHRNAGDILVGSQFLIDQTGDSPTFTHAGGKIQLGGAAGSLPSLTFRNGVVNVGANSIGAVQSGTRPLAFEDTTVNLAQSLSLAINNTFITRSTVNGPGALTLGFPATHTITQSTLAAPTNINSTTIMRGDNAIAGPLTTGTASAIKVTADAQSTGPAHLDVAAGFTNNGNLQLLRDGATPATMRIGGNFINSGFVELTQASRLDVSGAFTQNSGAGRGFITHVTGPAADPQYGRLAATGAVTLSGDFTASFLALTPDYDFAVPVITGAAITGSFSKVTGYGLPASRVARLRYSPGVVTLAIAAPAPSALDLVTESDTGVSQTDNRTRDDTPTFAGTATPGTTVRITAGDTVATMPVTSGNWSITLPPMSDGAHTLGVEVIDVDGDITRAPNVFFLRIDRASPTASFAPVPSPRLGSVNAVEVIYSEPVFGLTAADLSLSRDGGPNRLGGPHQITQAPTGIWSLGDLSSVTNDAGAYTLALADATGITDVVGNELLPVSPMTWVNLLVAVGTAAADAVRLRRDALNPDLVQLFISNEAAPALTPLYAVRTRDIPALHVSAGNGPDDIIIDFGYGAPGNGVIVAGDEQDRLLIDNLVTNDALTLKKAELTVGSFTVDHTDISAVVAASGPLPQTIEVGAVAIEQGARFDLADGILVVRADDGQQSVLDNLNDAIARARNAPEGLWRGEGLTTSRATDVTSLCAGVIGDDVIVKHTYTGDADLNGVIDLDDYFTVDSNFISRPAGAFGCQAGDFNFDRQIDLDDYFLIDSAFLAQNTPARETVGPPAAAVAVADAPAPFARARPAPADPSAVPAPLRINVGGPARTTTDGIPFAADTGPRRGAGRRREAFDVANTADDELFHDWRQSRSFRIAHPVADGNYTLWLWFAEPTATRVGQRRFDVKVEGRPVLDDYDIFADAGKAAAVVKAFDVTITDGRLDLSFRGVRGDAVVSAFTLIPTDVPPEMKPYVFGCPDAQSLEAVENGNRVKSASNLRQIGSYILFYANDNKGRLPADLGSLLDYGLPHPTFASPRTTTLQPRGEMSDLEQAAWVGQLKDYIYLGGGKRYQDFDRDDVLAYENPDRVSGPLAVLFADGHVEILPRPDAVARIGIPDAPPSHAPPPIAPASPDCQRDPALLASGQNLRNISGPIFAYYNDHGGRYPEDLGALFAAGRNLRVTDFHNPRGDTPPPAADLTQEQKVAWVTAASDYLYVRPTARFAGADDVVVYENPVGFADGIHILFGNGRVEFREMRWAMETLQRAGVA